MIHHNPFSLRVMISKEEAIRLDEFSTAWKARKVSETTHIANMSIERVYSFHNESNMEQFQKGLLQFKSAKVI